jgi:hypothetical protein
MRRSGRTLTAEARRLLDAIAAWPDGVLEPVLRAHGFQHKRIVALIGARLVTGSVEYSTAGRQQALIMRVKITQTGCLALQSAAMRKRA